MVGQTEDSSGRLGVGLLEAGGDVLTKWAERWDGSGMLGLGAARKSGARFRGRGATSNAHRLGVISTSPLVKKSNGLLDYESTYGNR